MPHSLGKYPFPLVCARYLKALEGHRAELTLKQLARDLNTIWDDVRSLRDAGKVSTTNPYKMAVEDLAALIAHWRTRPRRGVGQRGGALDPTSQKHLWTALKGLLLFCGNAAPAQLQHQMPWVEIPQTQDKPIDVLSNDDLERLQVAAEGISGWRGVVAGFLVPFCPGTGLRPKEVRLEEVACVYPDAGFLIVCHPKGEGKYAAPHTQQAPLSDDAAQAYKDFLQERAAFLGGETHPSLIPYRHEDGRLDYWPEACLRKLKADLEKASGVTFKMKTFRATMGQMAIDNEADVQDVSRAMRHSSTAITERYYARVRPKIAIEHVRQALSKPKIRVV
jgi:integrase